MDPSRNFDHLKYLVKKLTTSGSETLDEQRFKKVKSICKQSDIFVQKLHENIFEQFKRKHAEVRYSCFQICDAIFQRSHCFRCLILEDITGLLDLVFGTDLKKGKLEPLITAKNLKSLSISSIKKWDEKYGTAYNALPYAINCMRYQRNVDFELNTTMTEKEKKIFYQERKKAEEIKTKRVTKMTEELEQMTPQLNADLTAFKNCFNLLIPSVNDFIVPEPDNTMSESVDTITDGDESGSSEDDCNEPLSSTLYGSDFVRSSGLLRSTIVKIDLSEIRRVQTTEDNESVIENLKELINVLSKQYLPRIKELQKHMIKYSEGNSDLIKQLISLKNSLEGAVSLYTSVTILPMSKICPVTVSSRSKIPSNMNSDDSDADDDFIEVDETDPRVACAMLSEAQLLGVSGSFNDWLSDAGAGSSSDVHVAVTTIESASASSLNNLIQNRDSYTKVASEVERKAPTASSNVKHQNAEWVKSSCNIQPVDLTPESFSAHLAPPVSYVNPLAGLSQVWMSSSAGEENHSEGRLCSMLGIATVAVNVASAAPEQVRWCCRAPLPSGRLCPRRDRRVCPLHGPVLPRTPVGEPDIHYANTVLMDAICAHDTALGLDPELYRISGTEAHLLAGDNCAQVEIMDTGRRLESDDSEDEETGNRDSSSTTKSQLRNSDETEHCPATAVEAGGFIHESDDEADSSSHCGSKSIIQKPLDIKSTTIDQRISPSPSSNGLVSAVDFCPKSPITNGAVRNNCSDSDPPAKQMKIPDANLQYNNDTDVSNLNQQQSSNGQSATASEIKALEAAVSAAGRQLSTVRAARVKEAGTGGGNDWQNLALLADIRAATGVDLDLRNLRKRGHAGGSGLTSLKKTGPRERLARRVLSRAAVAKLNRTLARHS